MRACITRWLLAGLFVLTIGASAATAQRSQVLNAFQESLLSLEAETPAFRHFEGLTLQDFRDGGGGGDTLLRDALVEAKEEANALQALAEELMEDAGSLSEGLYLAPGVELDAAMMYRVSAWELARYFEIWSLVLAEIQQAETSSPTSFWQFEEELESANEAYDAARIYRILANQQYMLENPNVGASAE